MVVARSIVHHVDTVIVVVSGAVGMMVSYGKSLWQ
jgi:hypothetical protein